MAKKLNVAFIGGLSNGQIVLEYLQKNKNVNLCLIITYPDDVQVARKASLNEHLGLAEVLKGLDANSYVEQIRRHDIDYIFVAGWSGLLSEEVLNSAKLGVIGFHPSKLPHDRGRSVLAWQLEEGYEHGGLTMFYYSTYPDGGDIIAQETFPIEYNDDINDVLDKVDDATYNLMKAYFPQLYRGIAPRKVQNISEGNFRRLRGAKDSLINWNTNAVAIYNKVRAITKPYPGAEANIAGVNYKVWAVEVLTEFPFGNELSSGCLVAKLFDGSMIVRCKDEFVRVYQFEKM